MKKFICLRYVHFVCLFACLFAPFYTSAQKNITVLKNNLQQANNDSTALNAYNAIFLHYEYSNPDSDIYYMKQGVALFTAHKYLRGIAEMLSNLGGAYSTQGMLDIALKTDSEALKIYNETNNKRGIANAHDILGVIEGRKSNYSEATRHFFIALKIYEDINDTDAIADTYVKLGTANEMINNFDKALEYYNKGLLLLKNKPVTDIVIFLNNNIGSVYVNKKDYADAVKYLQKALEESAQPAYMQIRLLPLENMGDVYAKMGNLKEALSYTRQALSIAENENLPEDKARILITIADLTRKNNPEKAIELLDTAMLTAQRIGEKSIQVDVLNSMLDIYKEKGNYKQAFSLLQQQKNLSDSILSVDKTRTIANLEALYDFDKLNFKIQELASSEQKQKQTKNTIAAVALLLTIFLFVLAFFFWKTKVLNAKLYERELRLQKSSMVKNKLISIIAHDLTGSIRFMPTALRLCRDKSIPTEEKNSLLLQVELNAIASYQTLQNMLDWGKAQIQGIILNQSNFNVNEVSAEVLQFTNIAASNKQITIHNGIAPETEVFADVNHFKFIFRNLLSNAIKYTNKNGEIVITAEKEKDIPYIIFSIQDNGIGISDDKKRKIFDPYGTTTIGTDNEKGNGIGLNLCKEFLIENGGDIWMESEPNKGSIFYFSLKSRQ